MNEVFKQHLFKALSGDVRYDGRKLLEIRKVSLEQGISKNAEGSARVKMGDTEVLAGVKISVETPYPDTPDTGNLMVNAELLPLSSPDFESGPPSIEAVEIARVVDRGLRESGAIDIKKLCIEAGEKVWAVCIDICTINAAGNIIDASALAAIAAIRNAKMPTYDGKAVDYKKMTEEPLPLQKVPVQVTVTKIGKYFIVDPTQEEEEAAEARLTVCITEGGNICAMQKGGETSLNIEEVDKMVGIAIEKSQELRKVL